MGIAIADFVYILFTAVTKVTVTLLLRYVTTVITFVVISIAGQKIVKALKPLTLR
jgi:hypothetical protein